MEVSKIASIRQLIQSVGTWQHYYWHHLCLCWPVPPSFISPRTSQPSGIRGSQQGCSLPLCLPLTNGLHRGNCFSSNSFQCGTLRLWGEKQLVLGEAVLEEEAGWNRKKITFKKKKKERKHPSREIPVKHSLLHLLLIGLKRNCATSIC